MSDVMLHGVLRMPANLWRDDPIDVAQRHSRYVQASDRIRELEAEIERLRDSVIEECAKVCETGENEQTMAFGYHFAEAIRALKGRE